MLYVSEGQAIGFPLYIVINKLFSYQGWVNHSLVHVCMNVCLLDQACALFMHVDHGMCIISLLQWLKEKFLPYLDEWEKGVYARPGFTRTTHKKMLLPRDIIWVKNVR